MLVPVFWLWSQRGRDHVPLVTLVEPAWDLSPSSSYFLSVLELTFKIVALAEEEEEDDIGFDDGEQYLNSPIPPANSISCPFYVMAQSCSISIHLSRKPSP